MIAVVQPRYHFDRIHRASAQGDLDAAKALSGLSLTALLVRLASTLPALTEREQFALLRASRSGLNCYLDLSSVGPSDDAHVYAGLLAVKGLAAEAGAARRLADRPEALAFRARLAPARARLNALAYACVPPDRADQYASAATVPVGL